MKKIVFIVMIMVLLFGVSAPISADNITLTIWGWGETLNGLEAAFNIWKQDHPNVELEKVPYSQGDTQDKLVASLMAGVGAPDIAPVEQARLKQIASIGGLEDLSDLITDKLDKFASFALENSKYDGKFYGAPWDIGPVALYYRADIFEDAGVEPPSTWDELITVGKKICKDLDGDGKLDRYLLNLESYNSFQYFMFLRARNLLVFDKDGKFVLDNEEAKEVFKFYTELSTKHNIAKLESYWTPAWWNSIKEGRLASIPIAVWYAGLLKGQAPELAGKWRVAPWPTFKGQKGNTNWGGSTLVVPSQGKHKDLAKDFVRFALTTREGQLAIYKASNLFPSYLPALDSDVFSKPDPYFGNQPIGEVFKETVPTINEWYEPLGFPTVGEALTNALGKVVYNVATVDEAWNEAMNQIRMELDL